MKKAANEIFSIFEKYKDGNCSYDRALEDASKIIIKYSDERPVVGYFRSSSLKYEIKNILDKKKTNTENKAYFDCVFHESTIRLLESIFNSIEY